MSESHRYDGDVCAVVSTIAVLSALAMLLAGRWRDGLVILAVAGMLLAVANWSWQQADLDEAPGE